MASPSISQRDWTIAKLHALPEDGNKYEIIDGVLYVTPSPRYAHQGAISVLIQHVWPYAASVGLMPMTSPADIQFSERTVVQPDLFVFDATTVRDWSDIATLMLAIEVLSPRTARRDRTLKRRLYQAHRIPDYWIVDASNRTIEVWRPDSDRAEILSGALSDGLSWQPVASHAPLCIDVAEYFRAVHGD